ncbi:MAG: tetratricopeptide repeat protein [Microbacteriaceae bacterium]
MSNPRNPAPSVPAANLYGAIDLSPLVNRPAPGAASGSTGAAGVPTSGTGVVELPGLVAEGTDANFSQYLELSMTVAVIVDLWADWSEPSQQLSPILSRVVSSYQGRLVLVTVEVEANPQLGQAFQAQSIPTVAAVVGGRPVSLFNGALAEQQLREVFDQVLALAAQNGVTGTARVPETGQDDSGADATPVEEPLPPHHAEAYDAIERGDFDAAITEYSAAIAQNPGDRLAIAGLAQVQLLARLNGKTMEEIRSAAAAAPKDLDAQLAVADLDLSGGHVEDAFDRVLTLFPGLDPEGKNVVRARLLDYFEIVGVDDPRVTKGRARLTTLLY